MKYLVLTVEMPAWARHPMHEFTRRSDAIDHVELITWNATGQDEEYAFFRITGDLDAYRDRIDTVESVRDYNLTRIDDASFYSYVVQASREEDARWRRPFTARNLVVVPPITYDADGRMTLTIVGDADDLHALVDGFPDGFDLTIAEVGDYDRQFATIASGVTDRQLEAVRVAVDRGYYAVPREAGLEEVADELGCAPSTASTHLRKAEARIMERMVERVAPLPPSTGDRAGSTPPPRRDNQYRAAGR